MVGFAEALHPCSGLGVQQRGVLRREGGGGTSEVS